MRRLLLLAGFCSLLFPGTAFAAPRYATPGGGGGACDVGTPCQLATAVTGAAANDEVIVGPGTYSVTAEIDATVPLNIHGSPGPVRPRIVGANGVIPLKSFYPQQISDLTIESQNSNEGSLVVFGAGSVLQRLQLIARGDGALALRPGTEITIRDSLLFASGDGANGVFFQGAASGDPVLRNDTIVASGPGSYGISLTVTLPTATVRISATNVIADAVTDAFTGSAVGGTGSITFDHSSWDTSGGNVSGTNTLTAAPLFVTPSIGDFHQVPGSPTIDAGITDPLNGDLDLDGNARALGGSADIGAYEHVPASAGGSGGGGGGVLDKAAPVTRIGKLKLGKRLVTATLTCPATEARCDWAYAFKTAKKVAASKRKRIVTLGSGTASATGGKSVRITLKLSRKSLRLIKRRGKLAVKLSVQTTDAAGNKATTTKRATLRPPKKKR